MGRDKGEKKSKKGLFAMLLAAAGAIFFLKKRKGAEESGWEEAKPAS